VGQTSVGRGKKNSTADVDEFRVGLPTGSDIDRSLLGNAAGVFLFVLVWTGVARG